MSLSAETFASIMAEAAVPERGAVAVACSGGVDSMTLTHLAAGWCLNTARRMTALIVDHGLRPESQREAEETRRYLAAHAIPAEILSWKGEKPVSNVSEAAREARYTLLTGWCNVHGVSHLLTAHHRDDQAETFLLRLGRGSGLDGLAGIPFMRREAGVWITRPLLPWPKTELAAYAGSHGISWMEDASNQTPRYARNRIRHVLPAIAREGITAERIAQAAFSLARAREAVADVVREAARTVLSMLPEGHVRFHREAWLAYPEEIRLSVLALALAVVSGRNQRPRLRHLQPLSEVLADGSLPRSRTLRGVVLRPDGILHREAKAMSFVPLSIASGQSLLWDGRCRITLSRASMPLAVAPLGKAGWEQIPATERRKAGDVPHAARLAWPALWNETALMAVPVAGIRLKEREHIVCEARFYGVEEFLPEVRPLPAAAWRYLWTSG